MITHSIQKTKQRICSKMISVSEGFIISLSPPRRLGPNFFPHLGTINFSQCLKSQEFLILAIAS